MTENKRIRISMPIDLLVEIWQSRSPNQTLDERIVDLLLKGIDAKGKPYIKL
jgi:hypothetical protein